MITLTGRARFSTQTTRDILASGEKVRVGDKELFTLKMSRIIKELGKQESIMAMESTSQRQRLNMKACGRTGSIMARGSSVGLTGVHILESGEGARRMGSESS